MMIKKTPYDVYLFRLSLLVLASLFLTGCSKPDKEAQAFLDSLTTHTIPLDRDDTGNVAYVQTGEAGSQKVIFLHGTPGSRRAWNDYLLDVPSGLEYISVDRPAFGDSDPKRVMSLVDQGKLLSFFLQPDAQGRLPVLVGHSYGATLAVWMAAEYPDKVGALLLLAGSMTHELDRPWLLQRWGVHSPWRWLIPGGLRKANDEVVALDDELKGFEEKMQNVVAPVVVLQGRKDGLVSYKNLRVIRENMINAAKVDITLLQEAGHFLPWNYTDLVKDLLRRTVDYSRGLHNK